MERWKQLLEIHSKGQQPFPWELRLGVSLDDFDEAWRSLVLDKSYIDAWGITVTKPRQEDRPGWTQYHLRDMRGELMGVITFSRVRAEQIRFTVTSTGENDSLVMLCMSTFISSFLDERNWDQLLEENITSLERLRGVPKQIETSIQPQDPAPLLPNEDDKEEVPRLGIQIKTTVVHYAHMIKGSLQEHAADKMETSAKSYRKYRDQGWLLSDEQFKKLTGKTVAEFWEQATGI